MVKISDVPREFTYPMMELSVLLANVTFALLTAFVFAALQSGPFGLFSLVIVVIALPAYFRFAILVLDARAHGRDPEPPGIELFSWAESFWSLFPAVVFGAIAWFESYLMVNNSPSIVYLSLAFLVFVYPASMAVVAITRSPLGSINPVNIYHMIRLCGMEYLLIPLLLGIAVIGAVLFSNLTTWPALHYFAFNYVFFLMFTLTGAVLHGNQIVKEVEIETPSMAGEQELADDLLKDRQNIANHAYGFASRGNREGALRHIRQWIEKEQDIAAACEWFFQEMLKWEAGDAALFFAQDYFAHLLSQESETEALKLVSRCLHADPLWKPLQRDRDAAIGLAEKHSRRDLLDQLRR